MNESKRDRKKEFLEYYEDIDFITLRPIIRGVDYFPRTMYGQFSDYINYWDEKRSRSSAGRSFD